jgi:alpha-beta hydrolase superfamily lysophospholipase
MNAHQRPESCDTPNSELAQALYFGSNGKSLFGWLHLSPDEHADRKLGLVICNPFGYEATCAHRSIRAFAETAANLGIPALRFDYLGTGDSEDIEPQADQIGVWSQDIVAAITELQRSTGVERVCLLGIRLGALLATLAAKQCRVVSSVILVAPIVSGPRYLRQLRTTRLAARLSEQSAGSSAAASADAHTSMDVSGFALSAATIDALAIIELTSLHSPPAPQILIIDAETLPTAYDWAESLSAGPGRTKYMAVPGLVEMLMRAPFRSAVPQAAVAAIRDWLGQLLIDPTAYGGSSDQRGAVPPDPPSAVLTLQDGDAGQQSSITERPTFIASTAMLFGIVTEPPQHERRHRGVILLNTGADFHIGANRIHVSLARHWARHGYVVLRLDLSGLGDSSTAANCPNDDVFPSTAVDEIRIAIDFLRSRYGVNDLTIGGICSGAYHALRAAAAKLPVNQILMINPQNYFWKQGMRLDELQLAEVVRNPPLYLHRLFSRQAWRQLLAGEVSIPKIGLVYINRLLLAIESTFRELARRMRIPLPRDLGYELEEIAAGGVRMVFLFAKGEPGVDLLKLQGGSSIHRLGDRCRVHIIDGGDHIFSQRDHRVAMEEVLTRELFARSRQSKVGDLEPLGNQS